jgi:hypothetical protein
MAPPSDNVGDPDSGIQCCGAEPPLAIHGEARLRARVDFLGRGADGPDQSLLQDFDAGRDFAGQHPDLVRPHSGPASFGGNLGDLVRHFARDADGLGDVP